MAYIKKVCSKCGKTISVDKFEYCCPLCGEFFEDISNDGVLQHQANEKTEEIVSQLKEDYKENRNWANKEAFKAWGCGIPIAFIVYLVMGFLSMASENHIVIYALFGGYLALVPILIPIINGLRYEHKLRNAIRSRFENGEEIISSLNGERSRKSKNRY